MRQMLEQIRKLRQMIKQAYVSLVTNDSSSYPQIQVTYNGKTANATRLSPYGLCSNPPTNAHTILLNSQGQESVMFALSSDMLNRLKDLKEGESALFNALTGSYVKMMGNGDIDLVTTADVNVTANKMTINNDVEIDGDLTVTGESDLQGTATIESKDFTSHKHSGVTTGIGNTGGVV